jgi:Family of unknown function (DUF6529)
MVNSSISEKTAPTGRTISIRVFLVVPLLLFAIIPLIVGFVASKTVRQSYETPFSHLFFSDTLHMKAWLITAVLLLAFGQLLTASRIYEVLPLPPKGRFYHAVHRWSGRTAVLLTLPVAYHCIFMLGFGTDNTRVYIHSLLGTFLYGAVLAKVFIVRSGGFRRWVLPLAGGVLFLILMGLWITSAFWFFRTVGIGI